MSHAVAQRSSADRGRGLGEQLPARPAGGLWGVALRAPVLAVVLGLSLVFCVTAVRSLALAWPITYPEGAHLAAILRVRADEPLYRDFQAPPYLVTPYPPVMYLLGGGLSRALDLSLTHTMAAARGVTLAASLATAGLVYALARAHGAGRPAALAGAGMLLPLPFLDKWGYAMRPDLPAVALGLLAALLLLRRPEWAWGAALVGALAFFTKQSMVAFPVAAVVWLWWEGRRGGAVRFAAAWLGAVLGGLAVLHVATDGRHELNVLVAHLNPTNGADVVLRSLAQLPRQAWLPLGLALGALAAELATRRRLGLPSLYWLAALAVMLFTLRGRGSDVNYFVEPAALACVLATRAVESIWRRLADRVRFGLPGAALLLAATLIWGAGTWEYWREKGGIRPDRRVPLVEIARAERVLAEEPTLILLAGKPLVVSDPFHLSMLTSAGRFDPTELARRVKQGEFDLIVLQGDVRETRWFQRQPLWPEAVRLAIKDSYVPAGRVGSSWLYVPG